MCTRVYSRCSSDVITVIIFMSQRTGWPGSGTWSVCKSSALLGSHSDHSHSCSKPSGRFSSCLLLSHEDRPKQGSIESYL